MIVAYNLNYIHSVLYIKYANRAIYPLLSIEAIIAFELRANLTSTQLNNRLENIQFGAIRYVPPV